MSSSLRKYDTKRDFLRQQSHEQLEIYVINADRTEENLRKRLFLLTGCRDFGDSDGTVGSCIDCSFEHPDMFNRCDAFKDMIRAYDGYSEKRRRYRDERSERCGSNECSEGVF